LIQFPVLRLIMPEEASEKDSRRRVWSSFPQ
jgi:hypothetical protein